MSSDWAEHGFVRVAARAPAVALADPHANAATIIAAARAADADDVALVAFPELAITGYSCEDLFFNQQLLNDAGSALAEVAAATADLTTVVIVGAPLGLRDGRLLNCAVVLARGRVLGAVPKTWLANRGEYYERRWFASGGGVDAVYADVRLGEFPIAVRQLFDIGDATVGIEICEDLWAPVPVSTGHALAGANVIVNLSASDDWLGKAEYRRNLVRAQSAAMHAAYIYVGAGPTESTKDMVFSGHLIVADNGQIAAESRRFSLDGDGLETDLDIARLLGDRCRNSTFTAQATGDAGYRRHHAAQRRPLRALRRVPPRHPFVPDNAGEREAVAREILTLQATGLARRVRAAGVERVLVGISGGLDSTLALLVAVSATELLGRGRDSVLAVSMPGPGTTVRTRRQARALARALAVEYRSIDIRGAVARHLRDIGHPEDARDRVYENAQARERTQILFNLANREHGLVVGTGDLSELALGWCTFNADHMANYNVNASVPKTLVRHLIERFAAQSADPRIARVLRAILDTPISPELLPPDAEGRTTQATEEMIGPYELHDFFLYQFVRHGAGLRKTWDLACLAFAGTYTPVEIRRWLRVFVERFFAQQFKRTTLPPGPKVGSVTLSPRADWRMPDEASAEAWLALIDAWSVESQRI